jgi:predicted nucleic acid-binding Zn ribbon protein
MSEPRRVYEVVVVPERIGTRRLWAHESCAHCGEAFSTVRRDARYCSKTCRYAAHYQRKLQEENR